MNKETEYLGLTSQMLTSGPESSSSNLIIACLLCHIQNLTLDFWDFFSHSRCQHARFDPCSPIVLSDVTSMAEQLDGFTTRSHLSHLKSCALSNIQYFVQSRLRHLQSVILHMNVRTVFKLFQIKHRITISNTNYNLEYQL